MGYAYARGIPVIAIRTDFRIAGHYEQVNLMLEQSARVVRSTEGLLAALNAPLLPEDRT
jgi:nucleoside 2-deoxyribosyltransferase